MHSSKNVNPTLENSHDSLNSGVRVGSAKAWLQAVRPKTLTASVIPVLAASALAKQAGAFSVWISIFALIGAIAIQIATNLINDYVDFDKGADTHERIGPVRVTQSQWISRGLVRRIAFMMLAIALLAGVPLVIHGGLPILLVGVVSLAMAYSYTGGPFPLAYLGLGDLFVILFFGVIAVGGVFFLQTGALNTPCLVMGLQIGFLSTVLIAINNLRDIHQDAKVDKKTLAVRCGIRFVRTEILFLTIAPFALQYFWFRHMHSWLMLAPFVLLPLAIKVVYDVMTTDPSPAYNRYLANAAALHAGFGLILALVLL